MTIEYVVIKTAQDTMDAGTLLLTEIALIMASISTGISGLFLIDYFRRLRRKRRIRIKKEKKINFEAL